MIHLAHRIWWPFALSTNAVDFCITQLKTQGPSSTCNESKEAEEEDAACVKWRDGAVEERGLTPPPQI